MERARGILAKARATLANERIWMKSALVERERGETDEARPPVLTPLSFHIHRHIAGLAHTVCMRPARLASLLVTGECRNAHHLHVLMGVCSVSCRS